MAHLLPKGGGWSHVPSIFIHSHHSTLHIMLILAVLGVLVSFFWSSLFALDFFALAFYQVSKLNLLAGGV